MEIDQSLQDQYIKPEDRYCSYCGEKLNLFLVDRNKNIKYDTYSGEKLYGWEAVCPGQDKWGFWRHDRIELFAYAVRKDKVQKKTVYDITVNYRIPTSEGDGIATLSVRGVSYEEYWGEDILIIREDEKTHSIKKELVMEVETSSREVDINNEKNG